MRIAIALFVAGLAIGVPAFAQDTVVASNAVSSLSARPMKSGVMTVGGKSFPVFRVQGGDIVADVIPTKPGKPIHLGPTHHDPLRIAVGSDGVIALKAAVDAMLSGKPSTFDATIQYNGRKLTLSGAHLTWLSLPSCNQDKAGGDLTTLDISAVKIKVAADAESAQVKSEKITSCSVALDGFPAGSIRGLIPGPYFRATSDETGVGEMRDYEDEIDLPKAGDIIVFETSQATGIADWARDSMAKGLDETRSLQVTYASAAGPVLRVSYGKALPRRVSLDIDQNNRVSLATENPTITKP